MKKIFIPLLFITISNFIFPNSSYSQEINTNQQTHFFKQKITAEGKNYYEYESQSDSKTDIDSNIHGKYLASFFGCRDGDCLVKGMSQKPSSDTIYIMYDKYRNICDVSVKNNISGESRHSIVKPEKGSIIWQVIEDIKNSSLSTNAITP